MTNTISLFPLLPALPFAAFPFCEFFLPGQKGGCEKTASPLAEGLPLFKMYKVAKNIPYGEGAPPKPFPQGF